MINKKYDLESNLEKEIDKIREDYRGFYSLCESDVIEICRHFYNFGISKNKLINNAIPGRIELNQYGNKFAMSYGGFCQLDNFNIGDEIKIIVIEK